MPFIKDIRKWVAIQRRQGSHRRDSHRRLSTRSTTSNPQLPQRYLMPCPFTGPKMLCAGPNVLSHSKNFIAFSASSKTFVPAQKPILLNANHLLVCKYFFLSDAKHFGTCQRTSYKSKLYRIFIRL